MRSPITNCYELVAEAPKLSVERVMLYEPLPGKDWMYSHHPFITFFKDRYYAVWSNGKINEDDVGQRIFWSHSSNARNWVKAYPLIDTTPGKQSDLVLSPAGFHQYNGELMVYFYQYEYQPEAIVDGHRQPSDAQHLDTRLLLIKSEDGSSWSHPIDTGLKVGPNHPPQLTHSGRLITSVSFSYPYTDDPLGITGWTMGGVYPKELEIGIVDDPEGIWKMKEHMGWDSVVCEGSFFQTDDDVIHMMLRTNTGYLKVTESRDDGETWSGPVWTDFTDNSTKT